MPAISVGSVEVDVIPSTRGIYSRLRDGLVPAATRAGEDAGNAAGRAFGPAMQGAVGDTIGARIGQQIGQQIAARITASIRDGMRDGITRGGQAARPAATRQGEETGGAFARSLRARLEAAFRSMPRLDVRLSDTGVDADLARLRARLETLSGKTIGIDVDAETARAEAADIEERLRQLGAAHPNVAVRADTAAAIAQLQALREEIDRVTADPARIRVETDGQLGTRLRAAVREAEASLPNVNIGADTSPAQAEIASLRAQLTALRDTRVGIDVDAATALARITEVQARLARLSASDADVAVRVDAGAAAAQLAAFQLAVNRLDGQNINVNTASAVSGMYLLVTAALAFGPAIIPVLPVVAAGLGAIAAAATAAAAGIGGIALVAVPAFKQIGTVLQAQKAAQDAATTASLRGGQASTQAAQRALQQASAQQALATAQRNAARQISDAERGVSDAQRQAAQANEQAAKQVRQARQSLADAYQQAADRMQQANRQVASAERDLTAAQKTARQAQADLTQARKDAAQQLEDLNNRLTDSQLSQRDAEIQLKEATAQRDAVLKNANSTELDKQKALLAYDQAVQRLKEQRTETARLKDETAAANKAGVDGSKTVQDAQARVAQAQQDVADKTQALKDAQANVAKTQIQNTRAIADAQEKLSEAQKNVALTQQQGAEAIARAQERVVQAQQSAADSIASAQRQIASASLSAAGGVDQAAIAQAKYRQELAKLTPSARQTMNSFVNLKGAFSAWSKSLQPAVMPIFTRALDGIRRALPTLTPFVLAAADAVKSLQDRFSKNVKSPFWQGFKKDLQTSVKPAIEGLGIAFGNIITGMAGIIDAFLPHMDSISSRMQRITKRFADWGKGLKGSPEFERFLDFASQKAPLLGDAFGKIGGAFLAIGEALAPVSGPVLQFLGGLAHGIEIVATHAPWLVVGIWAAVVAFRAWTLGVAAFNLVMSMNPIVRIALLIGVLIAAVVYAYNRFGWFRAAVQAAWQGIKTAALFAWNSVLKPVFGFIWSAIKTVGDVCSWLWKNIFVPAWNGIVTVAKYAFAILATVVLAPLYLLFKLVGAIVMWLWTDSIKPTFNLIAGIAQWLWTKILSPVLGWIWNKIKWVGDKFAWLYNNAVKPAMNWVADKANWVWGKVLKPVLGWIWDRIKWLGDKFVWLYNNAVKPVANWISDKASWLYSKALKPAFDKIKSAVALVGDAFGLAKDAIKKAWDKVSDIAKKPVNFIIEWVYTKGIKAVWDKVAGFVGLDKLPAAPKLLARGGRTSGGIPGKDSIPALLMADEFVIRRDSARKIGFNNLAYMNETGEVPGMPRFAGGGIVGALGGAWDWTKDKVGGAISKGIDWAKTAGDLIAHPSKVWEKLVKPILKKVKDGIGDFARWGEVVGRFPRKMVDGLKDKIIGFVTGGGGGDVGGTIPTGQRRSIISQALVAAHVPPPGTLDQWLKGMNTLITRESGWNPNAINRWDSNARAGHPSQGLAQPIPGTFNAYVPASLRSRGILDPVANVAAAVRYIVARYHNITNVQQANANMPPAGYDSGGWMPPGMNLMYNGLGQPEAVLTPSQWKAIQGAAVRGSDGASGPASFTGDLYLDSGEFLGRVRGEAQQVVDHNNGQLLTALSARPRR